VEDQVRDGLGAGGFLRVQRPENSNDTVSEGIAYGMILAAYLGDKPTFDGLWGYAKSHFDGNGLMHWQINASNAVIGWNAATDSDEDMALALIVAEKAWGASYGADATTLLGRILQHEVESGTNVLKPGDAWGGSSVTNPSYFAPGYYRAFKAYTGDARWESVAASCYQIIANLNTKTGAGTTGLLPDWTTAAGTQASGGAIQGGGHECERQPDQAASQYLEHRGEQRAAERAQDPVLVHERRREWAAGGVRLRRGRELERDAAILGGEPRADGGRYVRRGGLHGGGRKRPGRRAEWRDSAPVQQGQLVELQRGE